MPGTPIQPAEEHHFIIFDRRARELAALYADPVTNPNRFAYFYWLVMAGHGYRPYYPGCPTEGR